MIRQIKYLLIGCCLAQIASAQDDIFSCDNSKEFAQYLYKTQQYKLAQHEFERINFFCDFDSASNLLLLKSYRKLKAYNKASVFFTKQNRDNALSGLSLSYRNEYIRLLMAQGKYAEVQSLIQTGFVFNQRYEHNLGSLLLLKKWNEAEQLTQNEIPYQNFKTQNLINIAKSSVIEKRKKPFWAAALSVLVPGAGKMYCGYWGDGLISMAFCVSTSLVAYRSYQTYGMNSAFTWITGGLAVSYYSANVYGGAKAAVHHNSNIDHKLIHETENILFSDY